MINMATSTIGRQSMGEEPYVALIAAIFKQAAQDYRHAVNWMMMHPRRVGSREFKEKEKIRNDVIRFTKSNLFNLVLGNKIDPDTFLKMALRGHICPVEKDG